MGKAKGQSKGLSYLREVRPEAVHHLMQFFRESATHLDGKTRFLISIVTKVIGNSPRGVEQYVKRALAEGASPQEIIDAVLCAYPCAGLTRVVDAIDVILDMDVPGFSADEMRLPGREPEEVEVEEPEVEEPVDGWYVAGSRAKLEGGGRLRVIAGENDIAVFLVEGEVHAIGNRCPHEGGPLSEGGIEGKNVVCPLHMWRFNVETGACLDVPAASVPVYESKIEGDQVMIRLPQ